MIEDAEKQIPLQDFSQVTDVITLKEFQKDVSEYFERCKYRTSCYLPNPRKYKVRKNNQTINVFVQVTHAERSKEE